MTKELLTLPRRTYQATKSRSATGMQIHKLQNGILVWLEERSNASNRRLRHPFLAQSKGLL